MLYACMSGCARSCAFVRVCMYVRACAFDMARVCLQENVSVCVCVCMRVRARAPLVCAFVYCSACS